MARSAPLVLPFESVNDGNREATGGKAASLARLARNGVPVPSGVCITTHAYGRYVRRPGFRERIALELNRKPFEDMRWEEIWDLALRIRNLFLVTPLAPALEKGLRRELEPRFGDRAVVVRSSAADEDSGSASFAGLHESYVNVSGIDSILDCVRLVWASLWSDRALLYRKELGLDVRTSRMAVVVQEIVAGERSGIAFSANPLDASQAVIEAVHGLNQGLVDGTIEPDRWILDRTGGGLISHVAARREKVVAVVPGGVALRDLEPDARARPPLTGAEVAEVYALARRAEDLFGAPQDTEWTYRGDRLVCLQSRPVTTAPAGGGDDSRPWYLSLHRSLENLKALRRSIEEELLPGMATEADALSRVDIGLLGDDELAGEVARRNEILERWRAGYWRDCIPFAHGMRLFGTIYNDRVRPDDPHEFVRILAGTTMLTIDRNRMLEALAADLRSRRVTDADAELDAAAEEALDRFIDRFESLMGIEGSRRDQKEVLRHLVIKLARRGPASRPPAGAGELAAHFLASFPPQRRAAGEELLELARASYRLRDEDNLYLGRIEAEFLRAMAEGHRRIRARGKKDDGSSPVAEAVDAPQTATPPPPVDGAGRRAALPLPRQLVGQPASPGVAVGRARVLLEESDLGTIEEGEILVTRAISPLMTFVVPLLAGIVENRGGMLIHGAIIAREYGIPCVTGVANAERLIRTGDRLSVDGYLGLVGVEQSDPV